MIIIIIYSFQCQHISVVAHNIRIVLITLTEIKFLLSALGLQFTPFKVEHVIAQTTCLWPWLWPLVFSKEVHIGEKYGQT